MYNSLSSQPVIFSLFIISYNSIFPEFLFQQLNLHVMPVHSCIIPNSLQFGSGFVGFSQQIVPPKCKRMPMIRLLQINKNVSGPLCGTNLIAITCRSIPTLAIRRQIVATTLLGTFCTPGIP